MKNEASKMIDLSMTLPFAPTRDIPLRCIGNFYLAQTKVNTHQHSWAQIVFCTKGAVRIHVENNVYVLPPWKALWIPPEKSHSANLLESSDLYSVYVKTAQTGRELEYIDSLIKQCSSCKIIEVTVLLNELVKLLAEEELETVKKYESVVILILLEIINATEVSIGVRFPADDADKRVLQVCNVFLEDPRVDINLNDLINNIGASPSTFHRLFNKEMGCSFNKWKKQVLLAQVILLAEQDLSITQIAFELGYGSLSAFSFMVSQTVGITPSDFLKKARCAKRE